MLVLRSVCRKFRVITAELDFWYDSEFLFADLAIPPEYEWLWRDLLEQELLKLLSTDANLMDSLGRRKIHWRFTNLQALMSVMEYVPLFRQNARAIYLEALNNTFIAYPGFEQSPLNTAIRKLQECTRITKLSIYTEVDVDLDAIAASFPFLEILSCSEIEDYYGSLRELNCLRTLRLKSDTNDISLTLPWIPLNSAETLTELTLACGMVDNPSFDTDSWDTFVNLKSLNIAPLCDSICDFISRTQIHLDVFETSLIQPLVPIDRFINMLRAACFRNLKKFGLTDSYDDTFDLPATARYWSLVFDAFTSMLSSVEEVQVCAPLIVQCCVYFARMINLQILDWSGTWNEYIGDVKSDNSKERIERALDIAFADFMEKPKFAVQLYSRVF